jgi:hypothetical protein
MNESAKKTIQAVLRTLDAVTVSGRQNMDMLLGCILTLEKLANDSEEANDRTEDSES